MTKGMTRKHFVKQLMARGIRRNEANYIAQQLIESFGNYDLDRVSNNASIMRIAEVASNAINSMSHVFIQTINACSAGILAFSAALNAAIEEKARGNSGETKCPAAGH
ncbi:MAG: hypothetical protein VB055_06215 [Oscillospiraceae bacterium]|nr:hypothetical protein [Oscillospiraceae bacterium]